MGLRSGTAVKCPHLWSFILASALGLWVVPAGGSRQDRSHYEVLGIQSNATLADVSEAAKKLLTEWDPSQNDSPFAREVSIEVLHAKEILSNREARHLYDLFGVDPLKDAAARASERAGSAETPWPPAEPLWPSLLAPEAIFSETVELTQEGLLQGVFGSHQTAWLIQVYSPLGASSREFAPIWERLASDLRGMVVLGRLNLLDQSRVAARLAPKERGNGRPHFPNGVPEIIGKPPTCSSLACVHRFRGVLGSAQLEDFAVETVLRTPPVKIYGLQNLIGSFFKKVPDHKVRFLYLMDRRQLAPPSAVRYWAAHYWRFTQWGALPFLEHEAPVFQKWWGVSAPPALAIFKDPLMDPIVYPGPFTATELRDIVEEHKAFAIPQLRSLTVADMGCHGAGHPRAGRSVGKQTWYCALAVGVPGPSLSRARRVLLAIQKKMQQQVAMARADGEEEGEAEKGRPASVRAWREQRLSLGWLDGSKQQKYCAFVLGLESALFCSKRSDGSRVGLGMLLFQRQPRSQGQPPQDLAYTYASVFKGSVTNQTEVEEWVEQSVATGDPFDFPPNIMEPPALIEEDTISTLARVNSFLALSGDRVLQGAHALAPGLTEQIAALPSSLQERLPERGSPVFRYSALAVAVGWIILVLSRRRGRGRRGGSTEMQETGAEDGEKGATESRPGCPEDSSQSRGTGAGMRELRQRTASSRVQTGGDSGNTG